MSGAVEASPCVDAVDLAVLVRAGVLELGAGRALTTAGLAGLRAMGASLVWSGPAAGRIDFCASPQRSEPPPLLDRQRLAQRIDHTLLAPDADRRAIERLCEEARQHSCATVCVHGAWVAEAARGLAGTPVRVAAVVGFPCGANATSVKLAEASRALADGASELDMVLFVGGLKSGRDAEVGEELAQMGALVRAAGGRWKVILETCLLTREEQKRAAHLALAAGADFVKTSTGFSRHGATVTDVAFLAGLTSPAAEVKASGGIRDLAAAVSMLASGATRLGTSASLALLAELPS